MKNNKKDNLSTPRQKLSTSQKGKKWGEENINCIIAKSLQNNVNGRTSRSKKLSNYNLVNSKFDSKEFQYILNPYDIPEYNFSNIPLQIFNVVRSKVERLKGEELQRAFGFMAIGITGEVVQLRTEERKKLIYSYLEAELQAQVGKPQVDEQGNPIPQPELQQILSDFDKNHKNIREKWVNDILHYLLYREQLESKFNKGFEHALISAEEVYYVGISNGEPKLRVVNPPNFWFDKTPDLEKIQEADCAVEYRIMSKGEILDEFGEYLSNSDLTMLDQNTAGNSPSMYNNMVPGFVYPAPTAATSDRSILANNNYGMLEGGYSSNPQAGQFIVYCCAWRSMRKWGFLSYMDEAGEMQEEMVEDSFSFTDEMKESGMSIEWKWKTESWKGYKLELGEGIYFGIEALENQVDGLLPYVGRVYNGLNTESVSLVDLIAPYQALHTVIWHKLKEEAAKAKGKKQVMDLAQIPKSHGFDMDKWMKYYDKADMIFINSFEEGTEGSSTGKTSNFNQFTSVDMSISNNFVAFMNLIDKIEYSIDKITGISPQREGDIGRSETATNAGRAIVQSTYITEPWFYTHNECKRDVLNHLVKIAKIAYRDGKEGQFVLSDAVRIMLNVDGEALNDSEYEVSLTNSVKDRQILEEIKGLANIALQSDKANFSDIIKIFKSTSISEVENTLVAGEADKVRRDQENMDSQQNTQLQIQQMNIQAQNEARAYTSAENQLDRENKITLAQMAQLGLADTDSNGTPDIFQLEKIRQKAIEVEKNTSLQTLKIQADKETDDKKLAQEKTLKEKEFKLRAEEIKVKKMAVNKKGK